jgi:hypothetical protein
MYVPEVREGDGEEAAPLKFGEEVGKRGDERRLRLEFMEGSQDPGRGWLEEEAERTLSGSVSSPPIRFHQRSAIYWSGRWW